MAEEGQVISCHTVASWNEQFQTANASKKLTVLDFTASWCGPCRFITPVLVELAKKLPNVIFLKVDVDELKTVAQDFAVEAMPTFIFLKEGNVVDKVVGARKDELQQKITLHMSKIVDKMFMSLHFMVAEPSSRLLGRSAILAVLNLDQNGGIKTNGQNSANKPSPLSLITKREC